MTSSCPICQGGGQPGWTDHENARTKLATQVALARSVCFESATSGDPYDRLAQAALHNYSTWAQENGNWTDTSAPTRDDAAACPDSFTLIDQLDDALGVLLRFEMLAGADFGREADEAASDVREATQAWALRNLPELPGPP